MDDAERLKRGETARRRVLGNDWVDRSAKNRNAFNAEWLDTKLNLIDTPGYLDYFGEVVSGYETVVKIGMVPRNPQDRPNKDVKITKIVITDKAPKLAAPAAVPKGKAP